MRGQQFSIIIPTRNSAGHIDLMLDHYRRMGWHPIVFVDAATSDNTLEVCRRSGFRTETVHNPLQWAEGMIEEMSRRAPTDWIIRFDDDEMPTARMMSAVEEIVSRPELVTYQFAHWRADCGLGWGRLYTIPAFQHHQWRLYNRTTTRFSTGLHTPGIESPERAVQPREQFFVHLQWIVRAYEERRQKFLRYYRIMDKPEEPEWRRYNLPEEAPEERATAVPLDIPEMRPLVSALDRRFPDALRLGPRPSPLRRFVGAVRRLTPA